MAIVEHYGRYEIPAEFEEHFHSSCELMYIHEGELELISGDRAFGISGGTVYLVPSFVKHGTRLLDRQTYRRTLMIINPWEFELTPKS